MLRVIIPAMLVGGVLAAAITADVRTRKIPNRLVAGGLVLALLWQVTGPAGNWTFDPVAPGAVGLLGALAAFGVMLVGFLPLFAWRVMGAGDVKLIACIGAFFGMTGDAWAHLAGLALSILLAGGVLALARIALSRNASVVFSNVRVMLGGLSARIAGIPGPVFDAHADSADRMPYAVAIATGTTLYVVAKWSGWLKFL
jgi:prepilin peptidase CpaA